MKINVSVNGYGTIGKRVAEAILKHPLLNLIGIGKYTPDHEAFLAVEKGFSIFAPKDSLTKFSSKGVKVEGSIEDMIKLSDVIVDCSPAGKGIENKKLYVSYNKKAIFQGGESKEVAELSFNSRCNFNAAKGKKYIRVVSCNTTALCRIIKPLMEYYQNQVKNIEAILLRRAADPCDDKTGPINAVKWSRAPSHHAEDVKTIMKDLKISTSAFIIPHTLAHLTYLIFNFNSDAPTQEEVYEIFKKERRVAVVENAQSTAQLIEASRDLELKRCDAYVVYLLMNTFNKNENKISFTIVTPQESIVIPENIDALIAQSNLMDEEKAQKITEKILHIDLIKESIEKIFSNQLTIPQLLHS
ncbi:MAG: type II glyceraldehyde-3-phosphate dehydrogenase [Candidatus Bathyarchaeia archaeon]|nr:type II glyceraldehyde-3-phosphate dehydrogenase [Candidatus Bathyarchaeota archaeon]